MPEKMYAFWAKWKHIRLIFDRISITCLHKIIQIKKRHFPNSNSYLLASLFYPNFHILYGNLHYPVYIDFFLFLWKTNISPQKFTNYRLADNSVTNASVSLWFCLQRRCKTFCLLNYVSVAKWFSLQRRCETFCFVCFYQPALCRMCVFVQWTSCPRAKILPLSSQALVAIARFWCILYR